jgi:hypothetical protein
MRFIAHRANIDGPNRNTENTEDSIVSAVKLGFDCEIDVWYLSGDFWLGHDYPQYKTSLDFLLKYKAFLWLHCKHIDSLIQLKSGFNCFFHDKDIYTITTYGNIWGNINSPVVKDGIVVMPEKGSVFSFECAGICSDYILKYKAIYDHSKAKDRFELTAPMLL